MEYRVGNAVNTLSGFHLLPALRFDVMPSDENLQIRLYGAGGDHPTYETDGSKYLRFTKKKVHRPETRKKSEQNEK